MSPERLVHHELCFGCGRTNLFGLLMEVERQADGQVRGRGFVKQDHQGPEPGMAHEGVIAAALSDAMALACGSDMRPDRIEVYLQEPVPVGSFLDVEALVDADDEQEAKATATARVDELQVAYARGLYVGRSAGPTHSSQRAG